LSKKPTFDTFLAAKSASYPVVSSNAFA